MNYFSSSENELISNIEGKIYIGGSHLYKEYDEVQMKTRSLRSHRQGLSGCCSRSHCLTTLYSSRLRRDCSCNTNNHINNHFSHCDYSKIAFIYFFMQTHYYGQNTWMPHIMVTNLGLPDPMAVDLVEVELSV